MGIVKPSGHRNGPDAGTTTQTFPPAVHVGSRSGEQTGGGLGSDMGTGVDIDVDVEVDADVEADVDVLADVDVEADVLADVDILEEVDALVEGASVGQQ